MTGHHEKYPESAVGMTAPAPDRMLVDFLREAGLVHEEEPCMTPLTGGVASDIWKVVSEGRTIVVKKALPQLRVAQVWEAPVSRNASEAGWMVEAYKAAPDAVPRVLAHDPDRGAFAMTYLDPAEHPVWKSELRDGRIYPDFAALVGQTVAKIHAATASSEDIAQRFANDETFQSIRLEPYLEATARVHSDLAGTLMELSRSTLQTKKALVHGDVSPKNILVGPASPIILDAECAWYGDPAFDLAFCLNHLLLKCLWVPAQHREALLASFDALASAYLAGVAWEDPAELERRASALLPALFLARVDGKSPVEYLTSEADKDRVRRTARGLIASPSLTLQHIQHTWATELSA